MQAYLTYHPSNLFAGMVVASTSGMWNIRKTSTRSRQRSNLSMGMVRKTVATRTIKQAGARWEKREDPNALRHSTLAAVREDNPACDGDQRMSVIGKAIHFLIGLNCRRRKGSLQTWNLIDPKTPGEGALQDALLGIEDMMLRTCCPHL